MNLKNKNLWHVIQEQGEVALVGEDARNREEHTTSAEAVFVFSMRVVLGYKGSFQRPFLFL